MKRRVFLLSAAAFASPILTHAQPENGAAKRPLIGILAASATAGNDARVEDFVGGLAQLGYVDGKTATIIRRYAEFDLGRLPALAVELAALRPDVIVADTASPIKAARDAAPNTPIVGASMSYPVEQGLIASFAHPGGNITGLAAQVDEMDAKAFELALEIIKDVKSAGLLMNPASALARLERRDAEAAAAKRGISILTAEAQTPREIESAVGALAGAGASFIILQPNTVFIGDRDHIANRAIAAHLPTVTTAEPAMMVRAGIMLSYGVDNAQNYRRAASFVDRILRGAKPSELPIEFPARLSVALNLKTAKALGVTISQSVLLRADEVIE
jgi:putative ABC transport system substrate-binding protein